MKKFTFIMLAAAALMIGACDSQNLDQQTKEEKPIIDEPAMATISAGFESTTKSILDISGSYANVLWQSGDSFKLYSVTSSGTFYAPQTYTTTFSGDPKAKADFTGSTITSSDYYFACYPASSSCNSFNESGGKITCFGILPKKQTATAGTYDPAANLAFAFVPVAAGYEQLTFQNATTLLKVNVTGANVAKLDSIRVQNSNYNMAGLIGVTDFDSELSVTKNWISDANSQSVTLAGTFTSGTDYYIAVAPGEYTGLSIVFFFNDKTFISKTLLKGTVNFNRSTIRNLGTFDMDAAATSVYTYNTHTSGTKPVTICVIPDGYTSGQRSLFETRANAGMDYMFSVEPYKSYKKYFNVYFLWTPSEEEGATETDGSGHPQTTKNTAFSSQWGPGYKDMDADANAVFSFVEANCPDILNGTLSIEDVPILILINDTRYGGIAHNYGDGRTYCLVPYIDGGTAQSWSINSTTAATVDPTTLSTRTMTPSELNALYGTGKVNYVGDWRNVLVHEFGGHSFGRLLDEYWYNEYKAQGAIAEHSWTVRYGLNVTGTWYNNVDSNLPWGDLMSRKTTLVSSNDKYNRIGVFHGGDVSIFNRWRSEEVSCMIDNRPYFSTWQRVLIAKRIIELSGGTFNLDTYLTTDNPNDPVRDGGGSSVMLPSTKAVATPRPMLPPPVFHMTE